MSRGEKEVKKFSQMMVSKLAMRAHKGDWKDWTYIELLRGLEGEIKEFHQEKGGPQKVQELVDIANYCWMLADHLGGLE